MSLKEYVNRCLSFKEACAYLGDIPASTLREWTSKRKITSRKVGKRVSFRVADLDAFMDLHVRKSNDQLNQELEQKRQELNLITTKRKG